MTTPEVETDSMGWTPDDRAFGARLALIRQRMGWGNVKEAAIECGLPVESWRTWERDNVMPRRVIEIAEVISKRTGCNYLWLLTGSTTGRRSPTLRYRHSPMNPQVTKPKGARSGHRRSPDRGNANSRPQLLWSRTSTAGLS